IPIAAASFVIVAAGPVGGRRIAPIVHANLFTTETPFDFAQGGLRHGENLRLLRCVGEDGLLPFIRREIPIASAGFVIVAAGAVGGRGIAPIVHAYLEEGATRNFGADFYRAAISA